MTSRIAAGLASVVFCIAAAGNPAPAGAQETQANPESAVYAVAKKKPGQQPPPEQLPQQQQSPPQQQPPQQQPSQPQQQPQAPSESSGGKAPSRTSSPAQTPPQLGGNQSGRDIGQAPLTDRLLTRKLGSEGFQRLLQQLDGAKSDAGTGRGAPTSDRWFDSAAPRTGNDDAVRPSGNQFFRGGPQPTAEPVPVNGAYKRATVSDAQQTTTRYGGIPGGVVLEGVATGLGQIDDVRYDKRFNAFIVNDRAVYFMRVPPKTVAVLCRAIEEDEQERVGVSLGEAELVYGKVPKDSDLAWDLKLADEFLGDIVFAQNDWTKGYSFPDGFKPEPNRGDSFNVAVFFNFNDFQFQVQQEEVRLANVNFDVRLLPLSASVAADGNLLPDNDAIARGRVSEQFESNAKHVAEHIAYYRRERIVDRMFAYGEVAAFIRALKRADFDLEALAANIPGGAAR